MTPRRLGKWITIKRLGAGGNGEVWSCRAEDEPTRAIKVFRRSPQPDRMIRFRNEINFLLSRKHPDGIVPLLDYSLPEQPSSEAWYVMPVATPIRRALTRDPDPKIALEAVAAVAKTLSDLATEGVFHRDIKPDNLFLLDEDWVIGDFGLVRYPASERVTRHGRKVGPVDYMAPEMRDAPDIADGELADVYSLAKTVWVLLAGVDLPFPGPHRADDDIVRLTNRIEYKWARQLDFLIERSTSHDPARRPHMAELARELRLASSPETGDQNEPPDLGAFEKRIGAIVETRKRRREELMAHNNRVFEAISDVAYSAAVPVTNRLEGLLPGFFSQGHSIGPDRKDAKRRGSLFGPVRRYIWRKGFEAPAGLDFVVEFSVTIDVDDDLYGCVLRAHVTIDEYNDDERGVRRRVVIDDAYQTRIGTVHFAATRSKVEASLLAALPETLRAAVALMERGEDSFDPFDDGRRQRLLPDPE